MKTWHYIVGGGILAWIFWPKSATAQPAQPAQSPVVHDLFVNHPETYPASARVGDGLTVSGGAIEFINASPMAALTDIDRGLGLFKFTAPGTVTVVWGPGVWGQAGQAIISVT